MDRDRDRERDRGYAGSPNLNKKVTWKEPIEQHVSSLLLLSNGIYLAVK